MRRTYRNHNPNGAARHSRLPERAAAPTLPQTLAPTLAEDVTLRDLLTPEDVENALDVLRQRLKRNNKRVALRILKLYFGNAPKRKPAPPPEEPKRRGPTMGEIVRQFIEKEQARYAQKKPEGGA